MSEFYGEQAPAALGDPAADPPMTVRRHPDDDPYDPTARRVIKSTDTDTQPWLWVTAAGELEYMPNWSPWRGNADVADWPVTHPIQYCTAHRHAEASRIREGLAPTAAERGDMDVDAFKGAKQ